MKFWFAFIILHLVGIFYFWKVHKLIFKKKRQSGGFAGAISFIGMGFGQAYNLQIKKSLCFFLPIYFLVYPPRTLG